MKNEVIKASGSIHISRNNVSLASQKIWNVLLANAFDELGDDGVKLHTINLTKLKNYFYESDNYEHIKQSLKELTECVIEFNILNKDGEGWGVCALLSGAIIENGVCKYAYFPNLREHLNNPKIYSKISLLIQQKFSSKYSLALYEFCLDYAKIKKTPWVEIEKFRELLGVNSRYSAFCDFRKRCLNPAIKEINKKSDLRIKVFTKKQAQKISHVKFEIEKVKKVEKKEIREVKQIEPNRSTPSENLALYNNFMQQTDTVRYQAIAIFIEIYPEEETTADNTKFLDFLKNLHKFQLPGYKRLKQVDQD